MTNRWQNRPGYAVVQRCSGGSIRRPSCLVSGWFVPGSAIGIRIQAEPRWFCHTRCHRAGRSSPVKGRGQMLEDRGRAIWVGEAEVGDNDDTIVQHRLPYDGDMV